MRILFSPKMLVYQCEDCGTVIELNPQEIEMIYITHLTYKSKEEDDFAGKAVECPTCHSYISSEMRIKEDNKLKKQSKDRCQSCGVILGENDKFCNSCGSPV